VAKPIVKQNRKRVRKLLLHRKTEFLKVPIVGFIKLVN